MQYTQQQANRPSFFRIVIISGQAITDQLGRFRIQNHKKSEHKEGKPDPDESDMIDSGLRFPSPKWVQRNNSALRIYFGFITTLLFQESDQKFR